MKNIRSDYWFVKGQIGERKSVIGRQKLALASPCCGCTGHSLDDAQTFERNKYLNGIYHTLFIYCCTLKSSALQWTYIKYLFWSILHRCLYIADLKPLYRFVTHWPVGKYSNVAHLCKLHNDAHLVEEENPVPHEILEGRVSPGAREKSRDVSDGHSV